MEKRVQLRDLIAGGVVQPPLDIHKTYKGRTLHARIEVDGS